MPHLAFSLAGILTLAVLTLLSLYILVSLDDLLLDVTYLLRRRKIRSWQLTPAELQRDRPAHIAVMVGAWQEAGVVTPMIESTLKLMHYPASQVEFFVGVYPNDLATTPEVQAIVERFANVHCIVNEKPGPTSKSQNLNGVYAAIQSHEAATGKKFDIIAVHDAEDVIHPYTFSAYSALLKKWSFVQLPVFALFPRVGGTGFRAQLRRGLALLVSGSYADEFAEHHLHHLPAREALGLFLPSAGTCFAMRREVMHLLDEGGQVLTEGALAEDYELALRLWRKGIKVHFHVQPLPRLGQNGKAERDYVAVREYFPTEVPAAIKQKGRWTYGITLQTPQRLKSMNLKLNLLDRLTLWHDQKGKYTNLIHLIGYPFSLALIVCSLLGVSYESSPLLRDLIIGVLSITAWRMLMRGAAVQRIYGNKQAIIATLVLPGLPLRWLIGNYINTLATVRAWKLFLFPAKGQKRGTAVWDKTERKEYVPGEVLEQARRRLGDQLLFSGEVTHRTLSQLMEQRRMSALPLGQVALKGEYLSEARLQASLASVHGLTFLDLSPEMVDHRLFPVGLAREVGMAVLGRRSHQLLIATPHAFDPERLSGILQVLAAQPDYAELEMVVFATSQAGLERAYSRPSLSGSLFRRALKDETIALDMLPHEFERLLYERGLRQLDTRWQSGVASEMNRSKDPHSVV